MIIYNKSNIITNKDIYKDDERIGEIKQLDIDKINYDKIVTNTINLVNDSSNKIMNIYNYYKYDIDVMCYNNPQSFNFISLHH